MGLAVLDASVAVKGFIDEPYSDVALRLRSDFFEGILELLVPGLFPFEIMSALRYSGRFDERELLEAARDIDRSGFATVPLFGEFLERTVSIAHRADCTISDGSYLALAALQGCPLLTADERLVRLGPGRARVVHIREYEASRVDVG